MLRIGWVVALLGCACVTSTTGDPDDACSQVQSSGGLGSQCTVRGDCAQKCCTCSGKPDKKFGASSCNTTTRQCEEPADLCSQVEASDPSLCR